MKFFDNCAMIGRYYINKENYIKRLLVEKVLTQCFLFLHFLLNFSHCLLIPSIIFLQFNEIFSKGIKPNTPLSCQFTYRLYDIPLA